MADVDTKFIRKVVIESENGLPMDKIDFTLDFYVYTNRLQSIKKSELIRVVSDGEASYYAVIDSARLGRGVVKCRARIIDVEPRLNNMSRPVVIVRETGVTISPNCQCASKNEVHTCFEEGYKVSFYAVTDIPKQDEQGALFGVVSDNIKNYGEITEQMVINFESTDNLVNQRVRVNSGDKIVILVNVDNVNRAYKDNGIGVLVPFDTSILGSNGDYLLDVEGTTYRVYGEMALVSGDIYVTINS